MTTETTETTEITETTELALSEATSPAVAHGAGRGVGAYADVNGLHLYFETFEPTGPASAGTLILLHGGLGLGEMFDPIIPAFRQSRRVITVDLQGHGRTADVDRPIDPRTMAEDVAALIRDLGLHRPDVLGYSFGGEVALHLAAGHPELIGRAILVSANATREAFYPELRAQSAQMGEVVAEMMQGSPMYEAYRRVAPRPEDFARLVGKTQAWVTSPFDYRAQYAALAVPTLIACADADGVPVRHYVELFEALGGCQQDGGWDGSGRPAGGHALAVIPGETHYSIVTSPLLVAAALAFLSR